MGANEESKKAEKEPGNAVSSVLEHQQKRSKIGDKSLRLVIHRQKLTQFPIQNPQLRQNCKVFGYTL